MRATTNSGSVLATSVVTADEASRLVDAVVSRMLTPKGLNVFDSDYGSTLVENLTGINSSALAEARGIASAACNDVLEQLVVLQLNYPDVFPSVSSLDVSDVSYSESTLLLTLEVGLTAGGTVSDIIVRV
jgi:hypothetical protein